MILTIELVPKPTWEWNVRSEITKRQWDKIRHQVFAAAGNRCEICGGKGSRHPVECHERWTYHEDSVPAVQTLVGLEALCPKCHMVRHIGFTIQRGLGHVAIHHLQKVNEITLQQAEAMIDQAMTVWQQRSSKSWVLDISWLHSQPSLG